MDHHVLPEVDGETREFHTRQRLLTTERRLSFLKNCLQEQVLPPSAPIHLREGPHPFKGSARLYLEECIEDLKDRITVLKSTLRGVHLPHHSILRLQQEDERERARHQRKLQTACVTSGWRTAGRRDLISNLSSRNLTDIETEALSLGLKFDVGTTKRDLLDYVVANQRWADNDLEVGFKQGVIACCMASAAKSKPSIPRRYVKALQNLGKDNNIIITSADKGGGIVVMDKQMYNQKMQLLLDDDNTYRRLNPGEATKTTETFTKSARRTMVKTDEGKKLQWLLESDPRLASMRGLVKLHKEDKPMRPIIGATGSAPHRLAAYLAKPLSAALGRISGCHLRNSSDLMERLKARGFKNKRLAS